MFYLGNRVNLEAWMKIPEEVTTLFVDIEEDTLADFRRFLPDWLEENVYKLFTTVSINAHLTSAEYKIILTNEKNAVLLSIIGLQDGKPLCKEFVISKSSAEVQLVYSSEE